MHRNRYLEHMRMKKGRYDLCAPRSEWNKPGKTEEWWVLLRDGIKPKEEWVTNLRLSKDQLDMLYSELAPRIDHQPKCPNYRLIPGKKRLAITLYHLDDCAGFNRS